MGGFALLKIRSRKGPLLSKTKTPATPVDKAIKPVVKPNSVARPSDEVANKPNNDAVGKAPALPSMPAEGDAADSSSGSTEVSTIVTYESSNDDSTLSSIHSDSLTSFMGNLSPPKIEFTDKRLEELLPPTKHSPSTMCRGILKKNRSAPNERKSAAFAENLETKIRSSPAAFNVGLSERSSRSKSHAPSENLGKMEAQARNAIVTMVEEKLSSSGRSKTDVAPRSEKQPTSCNRSKIDTAPDKETGSARKTGSLEKARPAKKKGLAASRSKPDTAPDKEDSSSNRRDSPTRKASPVKKTTAALRSIKTTILRPSSSPETVTPAILASEFKLMEDFEPTVEIGEEVNDDENTVLTMEVLEGIKTDHSDEAGCDLLGNLFDCDATVADQKKAAGDEGEEGTTMISLFDDEGNEFLFEKREGEDIGIVAASTTSSDRSGCDTRVSNKVGTEIKFRNKYQDGSVVKHLGALYKVKKQCSGDSSRLVMRKVENEEVNLVVGGMEAEACRKASRDVHSSRGSKGDSGRDGSGSKGSSKESKGSEGTKGSGGSKGGSANPKQNRTKSKSSKGSKGQKKVAVGNRQCLHSKSDATSEADDSRWLDDDNDPKNHEKVAPRNQQCLRSESDMTSEADDSRWLDDGDPDLFRC